MLAPESTTNSFSSGFIVDGNGKLHSLAGEKEVALSVSSRLKDVLGQSPRVSAAASLLSFSLLLKPILKFQSGGTALIQHDTS